MSLANRCDRCGALIPGEVNFEKEDFDVAIMMGGELIASYEDLCPSCMQMFNSLVNSFNQVEEPAKPEPQEVAEPQEPAEEEAAEEVAEEATEEVIEKPKPKPNKEPQQLRERVTKQYPVKIKHSGVRPTSSLYEA